MIHLLCDALLLLKQNVLMQYSNNRNVFCCNNRSALFQYCPTLLHMQLWIVLWQGQQFSVFKPQKLKAYTETQIHIYMMCCF